ncbi:MAG: ACT domain-containing protein [Clostridia bacterium]|nr:ACT domain-containing protein [Clostridia bacterium]
MQKGKKAQGTQWVIADVQTLPDVFEKVLKAKEYLASGEVETAVEAAQKAGLSRSAFYKYRDAVFAYREGATGGLLTTHLLLQDKPGVLSMVLASFADAGANILTVNQNIPADGTATVSISARIDRLSMTVDAFLTSLQKLKGVEKVTRMAISQGEI